MKRSVLLGLFVTASMLASPSFAVEDLCAVNLKTIENAKAQTPPEMTDQVMESVTKAKADQAKAPRKGQMIASPRPNKLSSNSRTRTKAGSNPAQGQPSGWPCWRALGAAHLSKP